MRKLFTNEKLCLTTLTASFVYITVYGFFAEDPFSPDGTASIIGLEHPVLFFFWGLLTAVSVFLNFKYMFDRYGYKNKLCHFMVDAAPILIMLTVCVKSHSGDDWPINKIIHWAAALLFALFVISATFIFFVSHARRSGRFAVSAAIFGVISVAALSWLVVVDKNGIIESVPYWAAYILMFLANFTDFYIIKTAPDGEKIDERKGETTNV